jgi:hypothetical protein
MCSQIRILPEKSELLKGHLLQAGVPPEVIDESMEQFLQGKGHTVRQASEQEPWTIE